MAQIDIKDATLWIEDGDSPVNRLEIKIGEGDFSWTETVTREYIKDRGTLDLVRDGDEEQMTVSFAFVWEYITCADASGSTPTIEDALKQKNCASTWVSTSADVCEPYAVDLIIHYIPNCTTGDQEVIRFPDFRYETLDASLRDGTISCAGACNATEPIVDRGTQASSLF